MNLYQQMWNVKGYGKRWARIMATKAPENRKQSACARVWARMLTL